jgi:acyl carrier protein
MPEDRIATEIRLLLADILDLPVTQVGREALLLEDLAATSADLIEIAIAIEDRYGTIIADEALARVRSVNDLCTMVSGDQPHGFSPTE